MCCCFEVFFLLENLPGTLDVVVLEEFFLRLRFSKKFLADLKMSSGLLECLVFIWFCIFCLPNIFQKVLEHFSQSIFRLTLAQSFAPFDYLHFSWWNFSCKFSTIGLNSGLKFSLKVLRLFLSQEILIFSCKVLFLEKDRTCFFSAGLCIFQLSTCRGEEMLHIFKLKK